MDAKIQRKFKVRDLVQLKTGSRLRMTVEGYKTFYVSDFKIFEQSNSEVECYWFQDNEKKYGTFYQDDLELVQ
jgi:uncharacterized protein YodC (DUF2158 family)